jgi:hypothetical protein
MDPVATMPSVGWAAAGPAAPINAASTSGRIANRFVAPTPGAAVGR